MDPTNVNQQKGIVSGISRGSCVTIQASMSFKHCSIVNWISIGGHSPLPQVIISGLKNIHPDLVSAAPGIKVLASPKGSMTAPLL